jgi:hypothetical protein
MEIQREIFTLRGGERKTIKTTGLFNCLRITCISPNALPPNNLYSGARFDLKSPSFTGDLYNLFLLNCIERLHYNPSAYIAGIFYDSLHNFRLALCKDYNDPDPKFLCGFDVYFTPQNVIDIGLFITSSLYHFQVECIYTDKDFSLCHSWKHCQNIISYSDFSISFDDEKHFALLASDFDYMKSFLDGSSKFVSDKGSFDLYQKYDLPFKRPNTSYYYEMDIPALWLDENKDISLVNANFGSIQKSLNLYYY